MASSVETGSLAAAPAQRYTRTAIALHWIVGLAVIGMIGLGIWMVNLPKGVGPFRAEMYNLHKSIGMTLGLLILARIAWRLTHPAPPLPATLPRWQALASDFTHHALYLCIVVQPVTGFLGSLTSPYPVKYFGHTLPFGSWDVSWAKELLGAVHIGNAALLSVLILAHVAAVLHHLLVRRDGVFQRMWFARGR
jgi:cytochrome b561